MTGPEEQQDLLPGLRASVVGSKVKARTARARKAAETEPAAEQPVARVLVDVALAHLDRPFDYLVPASMAADAQPGVRVKVRFAGQDVDGYVVGRADESDHPGRLTPLRRMLSAERVLSPAIAMVCNVLRLVPTSLIFGYGDNEFARQFHDYAGWVMLPVAMVMLALVLRTIRWLEFPVTQLRLASQ